MRPEAPSEICNVELLLTPTQSGMLSGDVISVSSDEVAAVVQPINIEVMEPTDTSLLSLELSEAVSLSPGSVTSVKIKNNSPNYVNNLKLIVAPWLATISTLPENLTVTALKPGQSHVFSFSVNSDQAAIESIQANYDALEKNKTDGNVLSVKSANFKALNPDIAFYNNALTFDNTIINTTTNPSILVKNNEAQLIQLDRVELYSDSGEEALQGVSYMSKGVLEIAANGEIHLPLTVNSHASGQGWLKINYRSQGGLMHVIQQKISVDNSITGADLSITPLMFFIPDHSDDFVSVTLTNRGEFDWSSSSDQNDYIDTLPEGVSLNLAQSTCTDGIAVTPNDSCVLSFNLLPESADSIINMDVQAKNNLKTSTQAPIEIKDDKVALSFVRDVPKAMVAGETATLELAFYNNNDSAVAVDSISNTTELVLNSSTCKIGGMLDANSQCRLIYDLKPSQQSGSFSDTITVNTTVNNQARAISVPITTEIKDSIVADVNIVEQNISLRAGHSSTITVINNDNDAKNNFRFVVDDELQSFILNKEALKIASLASGRTTITVEMEASAAADKWLRDHVVDLENNSSTHLIGYQAANLSVVYPAIFTSQPLLSTSGISITSPGVEKISIDMGEASATLKSVDVSNLPTGVSLDSTNSPKIGDVITGKQDFMLNVASNAYNINTADQGIGISLIDDKGAAYDQQVAAVNIARVDIVRTDSNMFYPGTSDYSRIVLKNNGPFAYRPSHKTSDYVLSDPNGNVVSTAISSSSSCLTMDSIALNASCELMVNNSVLSTTGSYTLSVKISDNNNSNLKTERSYTIKAGSALLQSYINWSSGVNHFNVRSIGINNAGTAPASITLSMSSDFEVYNGTNGTTDLGSWCNADDCPNSLYQKGEAITSPVALEPLQTRYIYIRFKGKLSAGETSSTILSIKDLNQSKFNYNLSAKGYLYVVGKFPYEIAGVGNNSGSITHTLVKYDGTLHASYFADSSVVNGVSSSINYIQDIAQNGKGDQVVGGSFTNLGTSGQSYETVSTKYGYESIAHIFGSWNAPVSNVSVDSQGDIYLTFPYSTTDKNFGTHRYRKGYGSIGLGSGEDADAKRLLLKDVVSMGRYDGLHYVSYDSSYIGSGKFYHNYLAVFNGNNASWYSPVFGFIEIPISMAVDKNGYLFVSGNYKNSANKNYKFVKVYFENVVESYDLPANMVSAHKVVYDKNNDLFYVELKSNNGGYVLYRFYPATKVWETLPDSVNSNVGSSAEFDFILSDDGEEIYMVDKSYSYYRGGLNAASYLKIYNITTGNTTWAWDVPYYSTSKTFGMIFGSELDILSLPT
ncbi:MAG: hypothetical protein ACO2ZM_06095 [Francisellaceae bacterium]